MTDDKSVQLQGTELPYLSFAICHLSFHSSLWRE
jgi:hypothetical protein